MKKLFAMMVAAVAVMAVNAKVVSFSPKDFAGKGTENTGSAVSVTKDGVTVETDKGYGHDMALRCYKDGTLKISASEEITALEFGFATVSGKYYNGGLEDVVTVGAKAWSNKLASQARIESLKVYIGEAPEVKTVDTLSVAEACARIDKGELQACYVVGKVVEIEDYTADHKNVNAWIVDEKDESKKFECYRLKGVEGADIPSLAECPFAEGDVIMVYAAGLKLYTPKEGAPIYETNGVANFVEVVGGSSVQTVTLTITAAKAEYFNADSELEVSLTTDKGELLAVFGHSNAKSINGTYNLSEAVEFSFLSAKEATGKLVLECTSADEYKIELSAVLADAKYVGKATLKVGAVFADDQPYVVPDMPEGVLTAAEAQAEGLKLAKPEAGKTTYGEGEVIVRGWVTFCYEAAVSDKTGIYSQSAWLADEKDAKSGLVQAYYAQVEKGKEAVKGMYVEVRGQLAHFLKKDGSESVIEIVAPKEGTCTMRPVPSKGSEEGLWEMNDGVQAVKTIVNGQLIIRRGENSYNMMGAQL